MHKNLISEVIQIKQIVFITTARERNTNFLLLQQKVENKVCTFYSETDLTVQQFNISYNIYKVS